MVKNITPASEILDYVKTHHKVHSSDIEHLFTQKELLMPRLHDLIRSGSLTKHNKLYIITKKGKKTFRVINLFKTLVKTDIGG